jgi:multidrug efflux pump subunit AcrA (membrane-fusion protein)
VVRHKQNGDLATPGVPIITIESRQTLLFETYVAEGQVTNIHPGDALNLEIDALKGRRIKGVILRIVPSGDPITRRYKVKIAMPNLPTVLPGMFGRAHFVSGIDRAPVVSKKSIVERGGLLGVFVLDSSGYAHFRWLRTGREWSDKLEVIVGLEGGERILAHDDLRVRDGDMIVSGAKAQTDE